MNRNLFGKDDGVISRLKNLVKLGMGGMQEMESNLFHGYEHDFALITEWVYNNGKNGDIYNCPSPNAIKNKMLMKLFRKEMVVSIGVPMPQ